MKIKKIITKTYYRRTPEHDWLKYFRVVRFWVRETYGIKYAELEMLLFLYGENLFTRRDFDDYQKIMGWNIERFNGLVTDGWVIKWRERHARTESDLYTLSFKAKRIMNAFYKKLSGDDVISENPNKNPIFKKNTSTQYKSYRGMIIKMNDAIRQRQRHVQE